MHQWGDDSVDWTGINDAAYFIAHTMRAYFRVPVRDYKEKYGTVRVYCGLGWTSIHDIFYPGYQFTQFKRNSLMWKLTYSHLVNHHILRYINRIVIPIHKYVYRTVYRLAVRRWPHLAAEILLGSDYHELLLGIDPRMQIVKLSDHSSEIQWNDPNVPRETDDGVDLQEDDNDIL